MVCSLVRLLQGTTSFTYANAPSGTHKYQVSVFYENGESPLSEASVVTGIHSIHVGEGDVAPSYNLSGQRVSSAYRGVVISNGCKVLRR